LQDQPLSGLPIRTVEKPWGRDTLPEPFSAPAGKRIGEIWFEPPPQLHSILVKYIFTSEALSVQVHPSDEQAAASGETARTGYGGKEECWLVIAAEEGAALGVGFKKPIGAEAMRRAALDGTIEDLLTWYPVRPGDFFYIPAGTVHAIGGGVSLVEIQQNSDITYRLYDYGRGRELHLDAGIAVARGEPHDPACRKHLPASGTVELARGRYFTAHRLEGEPDPAIRHEYAGKLLAFPLSGTVTGGEETAGPGECLYADGIDQLRFESGGKTVLVRPA